MEKKCGLGGRWYIYSGSRRCTPKATTCVQAYGMAGCAWWSFTTNRRRRCTPARSPPFLLFWILSFISVFFSKTYHQIKRNLAWLCLIYMFFLIICIIIWLWIDPVGFFVFYIFICLVLNLFLVLQRGASRWSPILINFDVKKNYLLFYLIL